MENKNNYIKINYSILKLTNFNMLEKLLIAYFFNLTKNKIEINSTNKSLSLLLNKSEITIQKTLLKLEQKNIINRTIQSNLNKSNGGKKRIIQLNENFLSNLFQLEKDNKGYIIIYNYILSNYSSKLNLSDKLILSVISSYTNANKSFNLSNKALAYIFNLTTTSINNSISKLSNLKLIDRKSTASMGIDDNWQGKRRIISINSTAIAELFDNKLYNKTQNEATYINSKKETKLSNKDISNKKDNRLKTLKIENNNKLNQIKEINKVLSGNKIKEINVSKEVKETKKGNTKQRFFDFLVEVTDDYGFISTVIRFMPSDTRNKQDIIDVLRLYGSRINPDLSKKMIDFMNGNITKDELSEITEEEYK
ncbi:hypothetical protein [Galbibacter sp. BG1]